MGALLLGADISKSQVKIVYMHIKVEGMLWGMAQLLVCMAHSSPRNNVWQDQVWAQTYTSDCFLEESALQAPIIHSD